MGLPPASGANVHERPWLIDGLERYFERVDQAKCIREQTEFRLNKSRCKL